MSLLADLMGVFTLTVTDTRTETDKIGTEPNGNLVLVLSLQSKHTHTILYKPFLWVSASISIPGSLNTPQGGTSLSTVRPPPQQISCFGGGVFGKDKGLTPPLAGNRGFEPGFERLIQNISYAKMVHIKTFNYKTIS